jgi:lysozyme
MSLLQRIIAAVTFSLAAAGFTVSQTGLPAPVERAAIIAGLMVLTPEMEGTRFKAYPDTGGVWTICTGHTGGVKRGAVATQPECAAYLQSDLGSSVDFVQANASPVGLFCKIAIADMHYNVGHGAVAKSTLLRLAQAGDQRGAAAQFGRWVYVGGKDCRVAANDCGGIIQRRSIQRELCMVGL